MVHNLQRADKTEVFESDGHVSTWVVAQHDKVPLEPTGALYVDDDKRSGRVPQCCLVLLAMLRSVHVEALKGGVEGCEDVES